MAKLIRKTLDILKEGVERVRGIQLGGWVLLSFLLFAVSATVVNQRASEVRSWLLQLQQPRLEELAQDVLYRGGQAPKAFNEAHSAEEASSLLRELTRAGAAGPKGAAHGYLALDVQFIPCYGLLLILGGFWARKRGRILADSKANRVKSVVTWISEWVVVWLAIAMALAAMRANLMKDSHCLRMLEGKISDAAVTAAGHWRVWKMWTFGVSAASGLLFGIAASLGTPEVWGRVPEVWEMIVRANRFAMRARFSIIVGMLFTVLLLTGPGEDIVRTIATGAFFAERASSGAPEPDISRMGWFAVALLILAVTCWGWARLVLAVHFAGGNEPKSGGQGIEKRLRRALPIYYGSVPFVAAASAFAIAPLRMESASTFPTAQFFAGSLAPLLLFFLLPLALVIFEKDATTPRNEAGPLSWTLMGYLALAALNGLVYRNQLGWLGLAPLALLGAALFFFGLARPGGLFILPAALLFGAATQWNFSGVWAPALFLVLVGALASWLDGRLRTLDELHIPKTFSSRMLLRLIHDAGTRAEMMRQVAADEEARAEMQGLMEAAAVRAQIAGEPERRRPRTIEEQAQCTVEDLSGLLQFCGALTVLQVAVFTLLLARPQWLPSVAGSGAILALGFAAWATAGSAFLFLTQATRFPILGAAIVWAVFCSGVMDNHGIRLLGAPSAGFSHDRERAHEGTPPSAAGGPIGAAFEQWQRAAGAKETDPPCIIVAVEGGGIRAAFWPAIVLGTLQDESAALLKDRKELKDHADFAAHVFAISGVSGGSFGAAVFTSLCANPENRTTGQMREKAARMCGQDHLAPTLGSLLYGDFVQRFLPAALLADRAAAFEGSWENAWPGDAGANRMSAHFSALWPDPAAAPDGALPTPPWLPALFLNSTMVETGKRAIASNLPILTGGGGQFIDAHDLYSHLRKDGPGAGPWQDMRLSTAAHNSARFPLVSPPGRLPSGARVVDGGYFENSGATTGIDVLNAVTKSMDARAGKTGQPGKTRLIFIFLRYADAPGLSDTLPAPDPAIPQIPDEDPTLYARKNPLDESGSIVGALLATQSARGSYSQDAVYHDYLARQDVVVLSFTFRGERIPLSWSLSQRSCNEMLEQFPKQKPPGLDTMDPKTKSVIESNLEVKECLLRMLYPSP